MKLVLKFEILKTSKHYLNRPPGSTLHATCEKMKSVHNPYPKILAQFFFASISEIFHFSEGAINKNLLRPIVFLQRIVTICFLWIYFVPLFRLPVWHFARQDGYLAIRNQKFYISIKSSAFESFSMMWAVGGGWKYHVLKNNSFIPETKWIYNHWLVFPHCITPKNVIV